MKGFVITEFLGLVESRHSPRFLQETLDSANMPKDRHFAPLGTYPVCEIGALVKAYSDKSGRSVSELMSTFGSHLFDRFSEIYPEMFEEITDAFAFLESVENYIHKEIKKLYPDAELPSFDIIEHDETRFRMVYRSSRHLGDLCEGLIRGCLRYFGEDVSIERRTLETAPKSAIEFTLTRNP